MSKKQNVKAAPKSANVAKVVSAMKSEMTKVKNGDLSQCAAIRNVAKQLRSVPWSEITTTLTKEFKLNPGTVRRQVQEGRAA